MIHGRTVGALCAALCLAGTSAHAAKIEYRPGEYVVKLKRQISTLSVHTLETALGGKVKEFISPESNSVLIQRPTIENAEYGVSALQASSLVEYAEPNYIYRIVGGSLSLPNDPDLTKLWGLVNTGQKSTGDGGEIQGKVGIDIDAQRAWQIETGSRDVVVAGIDTGIDYSLPDIAPNAWVNEVEKNGTTGVDDDGNGVVDDIYGYNAIANNGTSKDDHGHGSHTAGTIGGKGDDGKGIVGVAWNVRMMGIKFVSKDGGGSLADAVKAIDYTTRMKVDMTSNSWGGGGYSQALFDAIKRAQDAGILFIAAAGNSSANNDTDPEYPASYDLDNILSVAAIDNAGELAYFSCFGKTAVDVAAPGVNIYSSTPSGYESWSGTSMATPHVTGVAALLKANNPNIKWNEIRDRIIHTARPIASLRGKVASGGLVNAYHALMNTVPPGDLNDPFNWTKATYKISTPHPYADKYSNSWTIKVTGAKKLAIYFSKFNTETGYDKVTIKDGNGAIVAVWSGSKDDTFAPIVDGDTAVITFTTDDSTTAYGFDIDGVAYK